MSIRRYIDLVEGLAASMPVVTLKPVIADMKYILIDGHKVGTLHRASHDVPAPLDSKRGFRKEILWSGEFEWNGQTIDVGRTKRSKELLPKVIQLLRSALVRDAGQEPS